MDENRLRRKLETADSINSEKAIKSRMSKALAAERMLGEDLDVIVRDKNKMYHALLKLKENPREKNGAYQNALRWYYQAINDQPFPKLQEYERAHMRKL